MVRDRAVPTSFGVDRVRTAELLRRVRNGTGKETPLSADLWRPLQSATMSQLQASGGSITVHANDRAQRNLLLTLERMADANTVTKVLIDGPLITYRLRESHPADVSGAASTAVGSPAEAQKA